MDIILLCAVWFFIGVYVGMWAAKFGEPEKEGGAK